MIQQERFIACFGHPTLKLEKQELEKEDKYALFLACMGQSKMYRKQKECDTVSISNFLFGKKSFFFKLFNYSLSPVFNP